ncbi:ZinT/AdcA family metal-binding protein [Treponema sp. OMZ 791]|uniref:ZinT/AdcA family metal-binding protein n=1 Tax=Treponema sp. OMZ 791 TaxID=2563666 RepID=UPI0020A4F55E|nr:ZinT/AdcA family metal-binding protein [Treponema sp. OMZ 791]
MSKKNFSVKLVVVLMLFAALFTACKSMPDTIGGMKIEAGKELAAWKGEWVSVDAVKNDPSLKALYKEAAAKNSNYTAEGIKDAVEARKNSLLRVKFDGTNRVVFTVLDTNGKRDRCRIQIHRQGSYARL